MLVEDQSCCSTEMMHILRDMVDNKGFSKFICMPCFIEALAITADRLLQYRELFDRVLGDVVNQKDGLLLLAVKQQLAEVIDFRSALLRC